MEDLTGSSGKSIRLREDFFVTHRHDLICQSRLGNVSYYHYDGFASVRSLTNSAAQVTDGYAYDAFGQLLSQFGATANNYRYRGEQFDSDLDQYYLRARYYNQNIGRFTTVDPYEGSIYDPPSLHRYLYANADPVLSELLIKRLM